MAYKLKPAGDLNAKSGVYFLDPTSQTGLSPGLGPEEKNIAKPTDKNENVKSDADALKLALDDYDGTRKRAFQESAFAKLPLTQASKKHDVSLFARFGRGVNKYLRFEEEKRLQGIPRKRFSDRMRQGIEPDPEEIEECRRRIFGNQASNFGAGRPTNYADRYFRRKPTYEDRSTTDEEAIDREVLRQYRPLN